MNISRSKRLFPIAFCIITLIVACNDEQSPAPETPKLDTESYRRFQGLRYYETLTPDPERIQPYAENPRYWQYKGKPVLLLGASDDDNLFNHPDIWPFGLESHLDLMVKHGGNYVRNTMTSRDHGNVWPFAVDEAGKYDLTVWNDEYWRRFKRFLQLTSDRDIIVQLEVWDRWDFAQEPWNLNPFNPKNNTNYTATASGLPERIVSPPYKNENPFFRTPPDFEDNPVVLEYQTRLVDKILSISLAHPHVLYCISNETRESPLWSDYWAHYVLKRAKEEGVVVYVTEMWDAWDLSHPTHDAVFDKPDLYRYVELSQNTHQVGQVQWDNAQRVRNEELNGEPKPMNNVKIYSGTGFGGGFEEGTRKLWRNIFNGFASSRFHRMSNPFGIAGIGLSSLAQRHMHSMRMFTQRMNVFDSKPANHLLLNRDADEAYAMADVPDRYAVYFPGGGSVGLDLPGSGKRLSAKWLNISSSQWSEESWLEGGATLVLNPPGSGPWVVVLGRSLGGDKVESSH